MKPLFARAVRLSVVHSEILSRRVRLACDAVRVWRPASSLLAVRWVVGIAVESGGALG